MTFDGYWVDCGTRENILNAYRTLMDHACSSVHGSALECRRIILEEGASAKGSRLCPYTYISHGARIGKESKVANSVIYENARIGERCQVVDSIIDAGAIIPDGTEVTSRIVGSTSAEGNAQRGG